MTKRGFHTPTPSKVAATAAESKPGQVAPATEPLPADVTAVTSAPAAGPIDAAKTVEHALTPPAKTVEALTAPTDKVAPTADPLVKVDGTVPLPSDQLTPLLPVGEDLVPGMYVFDVQDGVFSNLRHLGTDASIYEGGDAAAQLLGDIGFELGLPADATKDDVIAEVKTLVRRQAALDTVEHQHSLHRAARAAEHHPHHRAERRGFPLSSHVDHDGVSLNPGDMVWVTEAEHAHFHRGTSIGLPWELGDEEDEA